MKAVINPDTAVNNPIEDKKSRKKVDMKKKPPKKDEGANKSAALLPIILLIIFLSSLAACGYLLYNEVNKELGIKDMEDNLQAFIKPSMQGHTDTDKENDRKEQTPASTGPALQDASAYTFDWEGMLEQSDYVVGWIQMPGIERINYPVVQHPDDNQFFLNHDWTGAYQSAGAIFMNKNNSPDFTDMNTVIYGHRMKTGSMFGYLKRYADEKFMDENPYFHIYTPDGRKLTYEAVCYSSVTDGSDAYLMHFETPTERLAYYQMMIHNAKAKRDVKMGKFDTTVMLSTCNGSGYYDRVVLLGKLVAIDLDDQPEDWGTDE